MKSKLSLYILFIFSFLVIGCGVHDQELKRVSPEKIVIKGGEENPTLQLVNAVNAGDLKAIKLAISDGADINALTEDGLTLLIVAIRADQFAIVDYLVQQGGDPLQTTQGEQFDPVINSFEYIETQLTLDSDIKDLLIGILKKEEFDVSVLNEKMFSASNIKNKDLISWFLEKGADPNFVLKKKETPLIFLFKQRDLMGEDLEKVEQVFNIFVSHPDIDVRLEVGRRKTTALQKANERLEASSSNSEVRKVYQRMVDKLVSMGAAK